MFQIWFLSKEDAEKAAENLSEFGRPQLQSKVETSHEITHYLTLPYEEALGKLEEVGESMKGEENPVTHMAGVLSVIRSLFETGEHEKLIEVENVAEAENRLYETVEGLEDLKELKERVDQVMEKSIKAAIKEGDPELTKKAYEDFEEYFTMRRITVEPILDTVGEYMYEDDPLGAFLQNVHLDVTPIANQFDGLKQTITLNTRVIHGLELDIGHVLHSDEVLQRLGDPERLNSPTEVIYGLPALRIVADEILFSIEGREVSYEWFVGEVVENINTSVYEDEGGEVLPYTTGETVERIMGELEEAGLISKEGNRISEA